MGLRLRHLLPRRLIHQVVLATALLISVSSASITVYFVHESLEQKFANAEEVVYALGSHLANLTAGLLLTQNMSGIRDLALQSAHYPGIRLIEVIDSDRHPLLQVVKKPDGELKLAIAPDSVRDDLPPATTAHRHHQWLFAADASRFSPMARLNTTGFLAWYPIEDGRLGWIRIETDVSRLKAEAIHGLMDGLLFVVLAVLASMLLIFAVFFYQFRGLSTVTRFANALKNRNGQQMKPQTGSREMEQLCTVLNDVSRQLHDDANALELNHVRTDALFRNLNDVIISTDERGIIESVNPSVYRLLGYMADELIGQPADTVIPEQHRQAHHAGMNRYLEDGEAKLIGKNVEIEARHRDGSAVPIRIALTEYWTGTARHFAATLHDLKDEIHLRKTELARQSAEAASRSKSDFLAHMSHEVRTPMNGVLGMLDVLLATDLDPRQKKLAHIIRDSADTQLRILNDILDFSKIEAGKQELACEPFDLKQTLESTCTAMAFQAAQKQVLLELEPDPSISRPLMGDALRLRQILSNLIANAIKFSASRPAAAVTLRAAVSRQDDARVWVEFTVTDNGIGIAPDVLPNLFNPFTQADSSTTKHFGGTGLGLAISQRLAKQMGGEISVRSSVGEGSTFTVRLPFGAAPGAGDPLPSPPAVRPTHPPAATDACTQKILVAEDNETNQEVIREQLTQLAYNADIASDGQQAYEFWRAGNYGLVLSDIQMPRMDGYQLATAIRQAEALDGRPKTPIISISANVLQNHPRDTMFDYSLTKPTTLQELDDTLKEWLPSNCQGRPEPDEQSRRSEAGTALPFDASDRQALELWDPAVLPSLVGDDPALHQRFLKKFLVNAAQRKTAIEAALTTCNATEAGAHAHALKSAARSVGAMRLGEICQSLEEAGRLGDAAACAKLRQPFQTLFEDSETAIRLQLTDA